MTLELQNLVRRFVVISIAVTSVFGLRLTAAEAVTYGDYVNDPSQFPEVVSIWEYDDILNDYSMICSGTLISQFDVLTAAHCVRNSADLLIELGAATLGDGDSRYVTGSWYHPRYSDRFIENDVGILRLGSPANVPRVARLPQANWRPTAKSRYQLLGWGEDQNGDQGKLRVLDSTALDSYAKKYWRSLFNPRTTISAGRYFKQERLFGGACRGDSGGPLFLNGKSPQRTVVGITSWGAKDCESFAPSVFSATSYAMKEIGRGLAQLNAESQLDTTPFGIRVTQLSNDRFTPRFRVDSPGTRGSKMKLFCFSVNSIDTGNGIRGGESLPYTIPGDGCSWTSSHLITFDLLSWEFQSGTNVVSIWIEDEQNRSAIKNFNVCKGTYTIDICSALN